MTYAGQEDFGFDLWCNCVLLVAGNDGKRERSQRVFLDKKKILENRKKKTLININ